MKAVLIQCDSAFSVSRVFVRLEYIITLLN